MSAIVLLSLPLSLIACGVVAVWAVMEAAWQVASPAGRAVALRSRPTMDLLAEATAQFGRLAGESSDAKLRCPDSPFIPQVTRWEAQAIAAELKRHGDTEIQRVVEKSRATDGMCPMRLADGFCACSAIRPLDCLGRCLAGADSPEWAADLGPSISTAFRQHLKNHQGDASTRGLNQAMLAALTAPPSATAMVVS